MADGVAFIEVRSEQGELVRRFTVTEAEPDEPLLPPGAVCAYRKVRESQLSENMPGILRGAEYEVEA